MKRLLILLLILGVSPLAFAETTCTVKDCEITITLKIAFSGANDTYINNAESEIENTWNGPNGYRTTGDCKCKMKFEVITNKTADCKNNPPQGWHCIMVTDYNNDPPRNQTNWTGAKFYIGYMYGVTSGNGNNSEKGWWSSIMSRPVDPNNPQSGNYLDFAHEAGHMMGLEDGDGGIMNTTSGASAQPTQANIDEIANDICGANACPDRCCCGNGQIDRGKGEQCDPGATPVGCPSGQSCCAVCCQCYGQICIPANGEYGSQSECQSRCGPGSACYKNYKTGCWDCVKQVVVVEEACYDSNNIRGNLDCDHTTRSFIDQGVSFYDDDLSTAPFLGDIFANERINIKTGEGESGYLITQEAAITGYGEAPLDDPTVTVITDLSTMEYIASGDMTVQQAVSEGRLDVDGEGIWNDLRFGFYHLMFDVYNFMNPVEKFEPPEEEPEYPDEYYDIMEEIHTPQPDPPPAEIGDLPDDGYFGSDVYPS